MKTEENKIHSISTICFYQLLIISLTTGVLDLAKQKCHLEYLKVCIGVCTFCYKILATSSPTWKWEMQWETLQLYRFQMNFYNPDDGLVYFKGEIMSFLNAFLLFSFSLD